MFKFLVVTLLALILYAILSLPLNSAKSDFSRAAQATQEKAAEVWQAVVK